MTTAKTPICKVMCGPENTDRIAALAGKKHSASGNYGRASASGNYGSASASGTSGIAAALCNQGTVRAGKNGLLIACWWDSGTERYHACTGEVGVDGIEADTDYCVKNGKLTKVTP